MTVLGVMIAYGVIQRYTCGAELFQNRFILFSGIAQIAQRDDEIGLCFFGMRQQFGDSSVDIGNIVIMKISERHKFYHNNYPSIYIKRKHFIIYPQVKFNTRKSGFPRTALIKDGNEIVLAVCKSDLTEIIFAKMYQFKFQHGVEIIPFAGGGNALYFPVKLVEIQYFKPGIPVNLYICRLESVNGIMNFRELYGKLRFKGNIAEEPKD